MKQTKFEEYLLAAVLPQVILRLAFKVHLAALGLTFDAFLVRTKWWLRLLFRNSENATLYLLDVC